MKNYLVFLGEVYYPYGGMEDFNGDFNTLDKAKQHIEDWLNSMPYSKTDYWYHVYSIEDKAIVYKS
jgi:hypothetical protein